MGEETDAPLLPSQHLKRTGTIWTAVAHIITGVIGSGVLSLAWSMAQLGWIAGPLIMIFFALVTLISTYLLSDSYRFPHPQFGPSTNTSYLQAVNTTLGKKASWICGLMVELSLYGTGIAYTITSAISMRAIQKSNCYHKEGHDGNCQYSDTSNMILFGAFQVILSQIPNFQNMQWLSIVAALMSFIYASIGFALGLAQVIENGYVLGSITGVAASSAADKVWNISQAIGDIAFAYPYALILLEIQDTLKSLPPENVTMKKASTIALALTTFFYVCCGAFGYAAFGENTPGNLLTGFGFYEPYWLIDFANASIVLHLLGAYQVYSQPVFATTEQWFKQKYPDSLFIDKNYILKLPGFPAFRLNGFRVCFRTLYAVSITAISITFPYFNQVIGLLGALNFWPLSIYFPVKMYFRQRNIEAWTVKWVMLQVFSIVVFCLSAFALVGAIEGVLSARLR
ncbi:probable amino acid permease 7 isoform X2 [Mercurialis annua]|nr:probable amino acid permease 7 isoform X2 [Mercurialis annua]